VNLVDIDGIGDDWNRDLARSRIMESSENLIFDFEDNDEEKVNIDLNGSVNEKSEGEKNSEKRRSSQVNSRCLMKVNSKTNRERVSSSRSKNNLPFNYIPPKPNSIFLLRSSSHSISGCVMNVYLNIF